MFRRSMISSAFPARVAPLSQTLTMTPDRHRKTALTGACESAPRDAVSLSQGVQGREAMCEASLARGSGMVP